MTPKRIWLQATLMFYTPAGISMRFVKFFLCVGVQLHEMSSLFTVHRYISGRSAAASMESLIPPGGGRNKGYVDLTDVTVELLDNRAVE